MSGARFEIRAKVDGNGRPTGFYKKARLSGRLGELPLILCDHLHPSVESARACDYFEADGRDWNFRPFFPRIY